MRADNRVKNRNKSSTAHALSSSTLGRVAEPLGLRATGAGLRLSPASWPGDWAGGGTSARHVTARPAGAGVGVFADAQTPPLPSLSPSSPERRAERASVGRIADLATSSVGALSLLGAAELPRR